MQDSRLSEQILGIESPWSVERVELELEAGEVHVHLQHPKNATWPCPECGTVCPLHDHEPTKTWRHLDTCQYRTLLHASLPRTKCCEHGVKVVKVFWAEPHSRFTMLFERLAIAWMQEACKRRSKSAPGGGPKVRHPGSGISRLSAGVKSLLQSVV